MHYVAYNVQYAAFVRQPAAYLVDPGEHAFLVAVVSSHHLAVQIGHPGAGAVVQHDRQMAPVVQRGVHARVVKGGAARGVQVLRPQ
eukprot:815519-Pyramimonas_sp.AAC.1